MVFGSFFNKVKNIFGQLPNVAKSFGNTLFNLGEKIKDVPLVGGLLGRAGEMLGTPSFAEGIRDMNPQKLQEGYKSFTGALSQGNEGLDKFRRYFQR